MRFIEIDRDWLYDQYITQKKTGYKIADDNGYTAPLIYKKLRDFDIPRRTIAEVLTGRKLTAEHIKNSVEGRKGYKHSEETKKKISEAHTGKICSEEHRKNISESMKGKTGSLARRWNGGLIEIICMNCGRSRLAKKFEVKNGNGKFCSRECSFIYNQKNKSDQTNIEEIIEGWLIDNNINYTTEHLIKFDKSFTIVDFFIEPNICLYCDGDYWHSVLKVQERDIRQNESLSVMGYDVIRLSGTEILNGIRPNL